jgi:hypothetical protein
MQTTLFFVWLNIAILLKPKIAILFKIYKAGMLGVADTDLICQHLLTY